MKELFIIISSKYRGPAASKLKQKLMGHFRCSKINLTKYYSIRELLARKIVSMKTLYKEPRSKTFVTVIKKSYGDTKRRCAVQILVGFVVIYYMN